MADWMKDHKRTAFFFVIRESDRAIYAVSRGGCLGVPGGKGERTKDTNDLEIAVREFREETGNLPPGIIDTAASSDDAASPDEAASSDENGRTVPRIAVCSKDEIPQFVAIGDKHHMCTYYFRVVPDADCRELYVGRSPEADTGGEEAVLWIDPVVSWGNIRPHIQKGIRLIRRACARALPVSSHPPSGSDVESTAYRAKEKGVLAFLTEDRADSAFWRRAQPFTVTNSSGIAASGARPSGGVGPSWQK